MTHEAREAPYRHYWFFGNHRVACHWDEGGGVISGLSELQFPLLTDRSIRRDTLGAVGAVGAVRGGAFDSFTTDANHS